MPIEPITIPYKFQPRPYQLDFFRAMDQGKLRALLRWCRRAGKDKACLNFLIKKMFERVGLYYYVFPEYAQGRKALWEGIDKGSMPLISHFPEQYIEKQREDQMFIKLKNGSIFRVAGCDKPDSLRGAGFAGIVFSEFAYGSGAQEAHEKIVSPMLGESGGWEVINSTPNGKNHMYDLEQHIRRSSDWYFSELQCLWPDRPNFYPVVTKEFLESEIASGKSREFMEQEYGVSYSVGTEGSYYNDLIEKARSEKRIGRFPHNDNLYIDTYWDLGRRDATAIGFLQRDGRAKIWIDYYEKDNAVLGDHVRALREKADTLGYKYRTHYIPHDGAAVSDQTNMSRKQWLEDLLAQANLGTDVRIAPKPSFKQFAIDAVRRQFGFYCFDEQNTGDMLTKLGLYHKQWDKRREIYLDEPVHDFSSHCADMVTTEALTSDLTEDTMFGNGPTSFDNFDPFEDDSNASNSGQVL